MAEEKYKPKSMTQEEWDALPPPPAPDPNFVDEEPDDWAEIFVANLNKNTSEDPNDIIERMLDKIPESKKG